LPAVPSVKTVGLPNYTYSLLSEEGFGKIPAMRVLAGRLHERLVEVSEEAYTPILQKVKNPLKHLASWALPASIVGIGHLACMFGT